jgi:hypothetical protein
MREVDPDARSGRPETWSFSACLATILELPVADVVEPGAGEDVAGWRVSRWLGGLGLGLVPIADVASFSFAGPWIARIRPSGSDELRAVVMFGVPSGVVFDPAGATTDDGWSFDGGYVVAALDIALARPPLPVARTASGNVETIALAPDAGATASLVEAVVAVAGQGLEGDRYLAGTGTFPPGHLPGGALTLIEAEVCESFAPLLEPGEHRRNIVTRGIDLNALVGHEFTIGEARCRGVRLCEPCTVADGYSSRSILRPLVHRGGLRADILVGGLIRVGDRVVSV